MKTIFIILFSLIFFFSKAQKAEDINLIANKNIALVVGDNNYRTHHQSNNKKAIISHNKSFLSKYNPFFLTAKGAMLLYQQVISPQIFRKCLYHRSCSNYSKKAIEEFGLIKGIFLSADRILRCNLIALNEANSFTNEGHGIDEPEFYRMK